MAMISRMTPQKSHPSIWAVGLFLTSSAFALVSLALCAMEFRPL